MRFVSMHLVAAAVFGGLFLIALPFGLEGLVFFGAILYLIGAAMVSVWLMEIEREARNALQAQGSLDRGWPGEAGTHEDERAQRERGETERAFREADCALTHAERLEFSRIVQDVDDVR